MDSIGPVSKYPDLAAIYEAVTSHRHYYTTIQPTPRTAAGTRVFTRSFAGGKVIGLDHEGLRYVEQNVCTNSQFAAKAREGAKIMWVIDLRTNHYLGRVEDGVVYLNPGVMRSMK